MECHPMRHDKANIEEEEWTEEFLQCVKKEQSSKPKHQQQNHESRKSWWGDWPLKEELRQKSYLRRSGF